MQGTSADISSNGQTTQQGKPNKGKEKVDVASRGKRKKASASYGPLTILRVSNFFFQLACKLFLIKAYNQFIP